MLYHKILGRRHTLDFKLSIASKAQTTQIHVPVLAVMSRPMNTTAGHILEELLVTLILKGYVFLVDKIGNLTKAIRV